MRSPKTLVSPLITPLSGYSMLYPLLLEGWPKAGVGSLANETHPAAMRHLSQEGKTLFLFTYG